ncbi:MAG: hypothetical protein JJLCMIEE_01319 [Acidimicrobiales bacterium]|nr:MAG: hypothetical protein EDR02_06820 [Actinomycetota bacterium]MBV6508259.1 hypothetical protein [Acidimicrobiales bacterium]RIK07330.1 MAG: hypothetical protein DCC48_04435 [Acidobacteriota bacterium]
MTTEVDPVPEPEGRARARDGYGPAGSVFLTALSAIAAAGLALRWLWVLVVKPTCDSAAGSEPGSGCFQIWGDALYHHFQGVLISQGHWFKDSATYFVTGELRDSAGDPPLYASFLGFVSWFGGGGLRVVALVVGAALVGTLAWIAYRLRGRRASVLTALIAGGLLVLLYLADGTTVTTQRMASAVVGAAAIVLIGLATRQIFGDRAGLVAAALTAVYPHLWISDWMLMSESLYAPLIALTIMAAYRFWRKPSALSAVLLSAAIAVATLTRAEAVLLYGFLVLPLFLWERSLEWRRRVALVGLAAAVAFVMIFPWIGYNLVRFEQASVFSLSNGTGSVLSSASCDETYYGDAMGYWANCLTEPFGGEIGADGAGKELEQAVDEVLLVDEYSSELIGAGAVRVNGDTVRDAEQTLDEADVIEVDLDPAVLDESERDLIVRAQAMDYIRGDLDRLPVVMAARAGTMWELYRPMHKLRIDYQVEGRGRWTSIAGLAMFYALLPLAVVGVVALRHRRIPVSPLLAQAGAVTVTAAISFGVTRYRVPADVALVILSAVTLELLLRRVMASLRGRARPVRGRADRVEVSGAREAEVAESDELSEGGAPVGGSTN